MFKFLAIGLGATLAAALVTPAAQAQNYNLHPSYGTYSLSAGFMPDPQSGVGRAGGDSHVNPMNGCPGGGWFANAPDFRLHYQAGGYALTFYIRAPGDTMLLVNEPAGQWFCNDDSDGLDPAIRFPSPRSGQYDIWMGTYNRSRVPNARLYVTELR